MVVKINGKVVNNLRYTDDTGLIGSTDSDLQNILDRVSRCLTMNISKTKFMVVFRNCDFNLIVSVDGKNLERVLQYIYIDAWVMNHGTRT